ncbi:MAG TPA: ABC transporter ATP-binding protein [Spirochaetia bacterium]|nr:ABC transporter ATP-binding protein [Spirochaetia bacterium]
MARRQFFDDEEMQEVSGKTLWRLLRYLAPYKSKVIFSVGLLLLAALAAQIGPYLVKLAVDVYMPRKDIGGIALIAGLFAAVLLASAWAMRARFSIMVRLGNKVIEDIRDQLFRHVNRLPFKFFDDRPAGKIIHRIMVYVDRLQQLVKHGVVSIIADVFRLVIILGFMFAISVQLSLIALTVTPFMVAFVFFIKGAIHKRWDINQYKSANLNAYAHESFIGIKVTQAFVREEKNSGIMREQLQENYTTWMRAVNLSNVLFPAVLLFNTVSIALCYWFGFRFLGMGKASLGTLIAFSSYIWMITDPIVDLSNFYNDVLVALAAADRIFDYLDTPITTSDRPGAYTLPPLRGTVEFRDVHFAYDPKVPVLRGLTFSVEAGMTVALVGRTGAGKSTIINLISRFYEIQSGQILLDGHSIQDVTLESLRGQVGVMMQDPFVFTGTIADNIRYGRLQASDAEVIEAARAVHAHEFVEEMPGGYEAQLKEAGNNLSVGQKQLLSFARTLLMDPRILILDEATASIDTRTELLVQQAIRRILQGRTSFVIAHRLSTIRNADIIFVIEGGRIVESGKHDELLRLDGRYRELSATQALDPAATRGRGTRWAVSERS